MNRKRLREPVYNKYDKHPQSPWVSVKDALPPTDEKVLICVRKVWPSNAVINPKDYSIELGQRIGHVSKAEKRYVDKYGFPNHGYKEFEVLAWMLIPAIPEEYKERECKKINNNE